MTVVKVATARLRHRLVPAAFIVATSAIAAIPLYVPAVAGAQPTKEEMYNECVQKATATGILSTNAAIDACCKEVGGILVTAFGDHQCYTANPGESSWPDGVDRKAPQPSGPTPHPTDRRG